MNPSKSPLTTNISPELSAKTEQFTESVIREMTRLAIQYKAVNLSQGFPDFPAPIEIKRAAQDAIAADINQYAITWGAKSLRNAIAEKFSRSNGVSIDPEREITVCCGSTEAMMSAMMAIINPGDEVVVLAPFYENYGPDAILSGAQPRFVKLHPPDWKFDPQELAAVFGPKTKAIILNTPNNPTGKVFERTELEQIRDLCVRWNAFAITDEFTSTCCTTARNIFPWPRWTECVTAPSRLTRFRKPTASRDGEWAGPLRPRRQRPRFARSTPSCRWG